jgi:D-inositol-3-phosphate glycosyltransferase
MKEINSKNNKVLCESIAMDPCLFVAGLFASHISDATPSSMMFGARVATDTFFDALLRYGTLDRYALFTAADREAVATDYMAARADAGGVSSSRYSVHGYRELMERFEQFSINIWHEMGGDFIPAFHLRSQRAAGLYPITFTHHTISYGTLLYDYFLRLLLADTYSFDAVICTSTAARTAYERLLQHAAEGMERATGTKQQFLGRLEIIPLGVDTDLFRPRDRADARYQLGLPQDSLLLLWFGRFSVSDKMDLFPLLRVFRQLVRDNPERKLTLILAGTERADYGLAVEEYARTLDLGPRVLVQRNFPASQRHLLHAAADIFVSPVDNIQETFGLTPIEAMACGVPQVVTDWDGYRDTVADGETGFLVPSYWNGCDRDIVEASPLNVWLTDHLAVAESVIVDLAIYKERLQRLIDSPELRSWMGEKSRQRAVEFFSWRNVVQQYETLWRELAAEASRSEAPSPPTSDRAPFTMRYHDAFGHYATGPLPEGMWVRLTEDGLRILRQKDALPFYERLSPVLDKDLIERALRQIGFGMRHGVAMEPLVTALADEAATHRHRAFRHVLWLLKYGLVEPVINGEAGVSSRSNMR